MVGVDLPHTLGIRDVLDGNIYLSSAQMALRVVKLSLLFVALGLGLLLGVPGLSGVPGL